MSNFRTGVHLDANTPHPLRRADIETRIDPELRAQLGATLPDRLPSGSFTVDDMRAIAASLAAPREDSAEVEGVRRDDGTDLELRLHRRPGRAAMVWIHGGGMVMGSARSEDWLNAWQAEAVGVTIVAPDYRLAPEYPYPAAIDDCLLAFAWASKRFDRIVLAGQSAGAGLAVATALASRDVDGPPIAGLHLYSPMLDDRGITPSSHLLADTVVWNRRLNDVAWAAYLGGGVADRRAAPARETDLAGLPPTYLDVGELDLFRDEDVDFALRIAAAGGRIEVHVDPGVVHGSDLRVPDAAVSRVATSRRLRSLKAMLHGV